MRISDWSSDVCSSDLLREMTFLEARAILGNYELRLGDTTYVADIARDVVLDVRYGGEELKAGQEIPKGSRINLILGNGMGDSEVRSEEHTSELQSLMRISYAVFCLKKKKKKKK